MEEERKGTINEQIWKKINGNYMVINLNLSEYSTQNNKNGIFLLIKKEIEKISKHVVKPILFILNEEEYENDSDINSNIVKKSSKKPDKRFYFFDSSIWYKCLILNMEHLDSWKNETDTNKVRDLDNQIKEIEAHYNLYKDTFTINSATEYREFSMRVFQNSYLQKKGGHAEHIEPFIFHSETSALKRAKKQLKKFLKSYRSNAIKIKILLIDDYAQNKLKQDGDIDYKHNKMELLKNVLKNLVSPLFNSLTNDVP